jgi:hypothetical protein
MTATEPTTRQTTIEVRNPADGRLVGEVPNDSAETVAAKARELRLFQPEWEALGAKGRKKWLLKFQDWVTTSPMWCNPSPASPAWKQRWKRRCLQTRSITGRVMLKRSSPTATPRRTTY